MNPYYYVFRLGTGNPFIVRHATIEAAQTEAERLAQKHKGAHFEILKAVAISHVPKPAITFFMDEEAPNQQRPFDCSLPLATGSAPSSFPYFHSGNEKQDVACLLDMAIDIIEIWDVKNSPYNQELKRCWMKRAQELGANISW